MTLLWKDVESFEEDYEDAKEQKESSQVATFFSFKILMIFLSLSLGYKTFEGLYLRLFMSNYFIYNLELWFCTSKIESTKYAIIYKKKILVETSEMPSSDHYPFNKNLF